MSYSDFGADVPFATVGPQGSVDWAEQNKGVQPIFFMEPIHDEAESLKAGVPRFRSEERVRLIVSGDQFNQAVHPVDDKIKERFAVQYATWKAKNESRTIVGTPLKQWALLTPIQIAEFEAANIFSVEMLGELADTNVNRIADGRLWRDKAKAWLEQAKDSATAVRLTEENARLQERIERLEKLLSDNEPPRRGPGRPPKDHSAEAA